MVGVILLRQTCVQFDVCASDISHRHQVLNTFSGLAKLKVAGLYYIKAQARKGGKKQSFSRKSHMTARQHQRE